MNKKSTDKQSDNMDITVKIIAPYKSIGACEFKLPKFCVLTGKNGSGKSHLLEVMSRPQSCRMVLNEDNACQQIKIVPFGGLNPQIAEKGDLDDIKTFIREVLYHIKSKKDYTQYGEFISHVLTSKNLSQISDISEKDLRECFDPKFMGSSELFNGSFALIFKNYMRIKDNNSYNGYLKEIGKLTMISSEILSDEEFDKKYGIPPWELVNDIFKRVDIPYSVNNPENDDRDSIFTLKLIDNENNSVQVKCSDLSTGEQVLMSLAMAIYNSDTYCKKPDLLLIDEPDAGLHPSMSKKMVNVLREFIVEKLEVPVIFTTHSPTTIAALDDIEIYEKVRTTDIPNKITKEEALTLLTSDIPFLTVSTEKRRAVFVESQYDADIYSELYETFKDEIAIEPHFFPLRKKKETGNNCDDVINVTKHFNKCGDIQAYGIVDWDNREGRTTHNNLLVLGSGKRYAIENYILDPLLVGLFLIVTRKKEFSDFDITRLSSYLDIKSIAIEEAQQIINYILNVLGLACEAKTNYILCNDWQLQTTRSVLIMQGHALEDKYKEKFPCLNAYNEDSQKGTNLKRQIIDAVVKPCSCFLSKSVLETLLNIK